MEMVVKCVSNDPENSKQTSKYLGDGSGSNLPTYPLTPGKEYVVYGIARIKKNIGTYLILDDDQTEGDYSPIKLNDYEPIWYDKNLFEVVEETIDPEWQSMEGTMWTRGGETISFPEFVQDGRGFYHWLLEGRAKELKIFSQYINKYEPRV
jgi:hypothetical protein